MDTLQWRQDDLLYPYETSLEYDHQRRFAAIHGQERRLSMPELGAASHYPHASHQAQQQYLNQSNAYLHASPTELSLYSAASPCNGNASPTYAAGNHPGSGYLANDDIGDFMSTQSSPLSMTFDVDVDVGAMENYCNTLEGQLALQDPHSGGISIAQAIHQSSLGSHQQLPHSVPPNLLMTSPSSGPVTFATDDPRLSILPQGHTPTSISPSSLDMRMSAASLPAYGHPAAADVPELKLDAGPEDSDKDSLSSLCTPSASGSSYAASSSPSPSPAPSPPGTRLSAKAGGGFGAYLSTSIAAGANHPSAGGGEIPVHGRRRTRAGSGAALPKPVPNLTKRSRGRKVPTSTNGRPLLFSRGCKETVAAASGGGMGPGVRAYMCEVEGCHACFVRGEHLKRHIRSIHTHEKPFECPHQGCDRTFSRRDNLNQHVRVHRHGA